MKLAIVVSVLLVILSLLSVCIAKGACVELEEVRAHHEGPRNVIETFKCDSEEEANTIINSHPSYKITKYRTGNGWFVDVPMTEIESNLL